MRQKINVVVKPTNNIKFKVSPGVMLIQCMKDN